MARKKDTITLSIPPGTKGKLEEIAHKLDITWGRDKPSVSGLLSAIAEDNPKIRKLFTLNSTQADALQQAIKLAIDLGRIEVAQTLTHLLLEQSNLEEPIRRVFQQLVQQPSLSWRDRLETNINHRQPFRLSYRNAQGEFIEFTVRYGEITFFEKRFYLNIWCEETDDIPNTDFPELIHNRCLRLDRIQSMTEIDGQWRTEGLDFLKVYLHFYGGLVRAYEPKDNDISDETIGEIRQVVRRVANPFWLIREVMRYGKSCEIVAPDAVRDRFKADLTKMCVRYGMTT